MLYSQPIPPPVVETKNAGFRPASSIYSEPSPNNINQRFTQDSYAIQESTYQDDDVSPPSSPEYGADRYVEYFTNIPFACHGAAL